MQRVIQDRAHYPVLHYFHIPDCDSAPPIALPALLELLTALRGVVDPLTAPALVNGPLIAAAYDSAVGIEQDRARRLGLKPTAEENGPHRPDTAEIRDRLQHAGIPVRTKHEAEKCYRDLRKTWAGYNEAVRRHLGYHHG